MANVMVASASTSRPFSSSLYFYPRGVGVTSGNDGLRRTRQAFGFQIPLPALSEIRTSPDPIDLSCRSYLRFGGWNQVMRRGGSKGGEPRVQLPSAAAADADGGVESGKGSPERFPALVTASFFMTCLGGSYTHGGFFTAFLCLLVGWYFSNIIFNILNKKIYNYFPYPAFVAFIHLLVGVVYCLVCWSIGCPKRARMDREFLVLLAPVAFCHALGHLMSNVSFASVAVSFTHTIKALEPFFNAAASQFVLGHQIPFPLWLSLAPVVFGVSMASLTELSFNWTGFASAMVANVAFTYRSLYLKQAMTTMDSTNVCAYTAIMALIFCFPPALFIDGPQLMQHGFRDAIAKVGLAKFVSDLFFVGLFFHLDNQLAISTLRRVSPLTHAVGSVLKRVVVIVLSTLVFGNKITMQTAIGTAIAITGVAIYSFVRANMEEEYQSAAST